MAQDLGGFSVSPVDEALSASQDKTCSSLASRSIVRYGRLRRNAVIAGITGLKGSGTRNPQKGTQHVLNSNVTLHFCS